jgi:DNA-binding transcriptional MerR regulator
MFRIGDFSRLSQISVKALRYYDEIGLLKPTYVDNATGYRYYSADLLPRLNRILVFKELGFSLAQIRDLLWGELPADKARDILQIKQREIEQNIEREQSRLIQVETWLAQIEQQGRIPAYEVAVKLVAPQMVASVRDSLDCYAEAGHLFDEINSHIKKYDVAVRHAALWHTCAGQARSIDCEAVVFLKSPVAESRRVKVYELPASLMACVIHKGSDEASSQAYSFARSWIRSNSYKVNGPSRELYWRGGVEEDDTSSVTEIQFPVHHA